MITTRMIRLCVVARIVWWTSWVCGGLEEGLVMVSVCEVKGTELGDTVSEQIQ